MTTYTIIKVCNHCDTDNRDDVNICRMCGQLMVSKDNKARIYRDFGKILPQKRPKRPLTVDELIEERNKFKIKGEFK